MPKPTALPSLYRYLSHFNALEEAVARSRQELLETENVRGGSGDWHLARLYLGRKGGGVLCKGREARRRKGVEYGHREFLNVKDQSIPVAGRREFVGRRRQIQQTLREFSKPGHAGILIHGFGRQGKSSLAARIANRLPDHQVVVIYGHYDALAILEGIEYFIGTEEIKNLLSGQKEEIRKNPAALFTILRAIIEGPCKEQPLLLVMDDFEQALDDPEEGELHRVKSHLVDTMRAVIEAFSAAMGKTRSRLLLTGRYRFTLLHKGRDLAEHLLQLHLPPMEDYEGRKQAAAKEKVMGVPMKEKNVKRVERCIHAARGNPGLQDLLFSLCWQAPEECDGALAAVEEYIVSGRDPDREKLLEFLRGMAIRHLLDLLTESEKELLRASTLFQVPVPLETLEHLAKELRLKGEGPVGERLLGFGLWEPFMDMVNPKKTAVSIHALSRPKAGKLSEEEVSQLACLVVQDLYERWGGKERKNRPYAGDIELARMALAAQNTTVLSVTAKDAVRGLENQFQYRSAAKLARESIKVLDFAGVEISDGLFRAGAELSERIGDMEHARTYIQRAVDKLSADGNIDSEDYAYALLSQGRMLVKSGNPDKALEVFKEAEKCLRPDRFLRERSIVLGEIARIQVDRGQVEEALKLHREELKVFEELGDRRSRAVTLGDIARIQVDRGHVDDALKLHQERLQVFKDLGDRCSRAVTQRDIARILVKKGEVDEALKLHHEGLDVFVALRDMREKAITLGDIARIYKSTGQVEEAVKHLQEVLKIVEELGDIDVKANTLWILAQIELQQESYQNAIDHLSESYAINLKLGRLDGICIVGLDLGWLLCQAGLTEEGLKILKRSRDGFKKLRREEDATQAQELIERFKG